MYDGRNIEVADNHVKFYPNFEFLDKLVKTCNIKFHYNRPVTAELTHADGRTDGRTDTTKDNSRFLQACENG